MVGDDVALFAVDEATAAADGKDDDVNDGQAGSLVELTSAASKSATATASAVS
jgi:hypothetical protein